MKLLVHVCCAPCFTYTHKKLVSEGYDVTGFFYNPNIHPAAEYIERKRTLEKYVHRNPVGKVDVVYSSYPMEEFIEGALECMKSGKTRCEFCYRMRLMECVEYASENGYDGFTTTLLLSPHQKHELLRDVGDKIGNKYRVPFHYDDFRVGWKESIGLSKQLELYRQKYCGCIFSEKERYKKKL